MRWCGRRASWEGFSPVRKAAVLCCAAGTLGHALARAALDEGYALTAFVSARELPRLDEPRLRVVGGETDEAEAVAVAISAGDVVFVALEQTAGSPLDALERAVGSVVDARRAVGARRLVFLSRDDVHCPGDAELNMAAQLALSLRSLLGFTDLLTTILTTSNVDVVTESENARVTVTHSLKLSEL
jgi:NAD(P)-dependent dehydrogenase (short-subunit alcohol dehydrogenase family)